MNRLSNALQLSMLVLASYPYLTVADDKVDAAHPSVAAASASCPFTRGQKDTSAQALLASVQAALAALPSTCQASAKESSGALKESISSYSALIDERLTKLRKWKVEGKAGEPPIDADAQLALEVLGTRLTSFFSNAGACAKNGSSQDSKNTFVSTVVQAADIAAALSPASGMVSAGISVSGQLISTVANQMFDKSTNAFDPTKVKDHEAANGYACLYVTLFARLAGCQSKLPTPKANPYQSPNGEMNAVMLGTGGFSSSFRKLTTVTAEIQKNENATGDMSADPLLNDLKEAMEGTLPPKGIPVKGQLAAMETSLRQAVQDPALKRKTPQTWYQMALSAKRLAAFLKAYREWNDFNAEDKKNPDAKKDLEKQLAEYEKRTENLLTSIRGDKPPEGDKKGSEKAKGKPEDRFLNFDNAYALVEDQRILTTNRQNPVRNFLKWESLRPDPQDYQQYLMARFGIAGHEPSGATAVASKYIQPDYAAASLNLAFRNMLPHVQEIFAAEIERYKAEFDDNYGGKAQPGIASKKKIDLRPSQLLREWRAHIRGGLKSPPETKVSPLQGSELEEERLAFFSDTILPHFYYCLAGNAVNLGGGGTKNPLYNLADHSGDPLLANPLKNKRAQFEEACRKFDCGHVLPGASGLTLFREEILDGGGNAEQVKRFKKLQCDNLNTSEKTVDDLLQKFLTTGRLCGGRLSTPMKLPANTGRSTGSHGSKLR